MPSSLATVLSLTLVFSTCPPVSVLVRAAHALPEAFPGSRPHMLRYFPWISLTCHVFTFLMHGFACASATSLRPQSIKRVILAVSVTPSLHARVQEYAPAFHPLRLSASRLVPTYPGRTNLPLESLGFRCVGFPPTSRYSHRHSHFYAVHHSSRYGFYPHTTLPYHLVS